MTTEKPWRPSYQQIIELVDKCRERRDAAGESSRMMAKWISEGLNALYPDTPADGPIWQVEEYKIWKGVNPDKPVWASLNFVSRSWDDMMDLCDYLRGNNPDIILRVMKYDWAEIRKNRP